MSKYQVLEVSDSKDFCMCCGRTGLKRVVFIRDTHTDEVKHFGTSCAASPVKGFGVDKDIKNAISDFTNDEKVINVMSHQAYRKAGGKYAPMVDGSSSALNKELFQQIRAKIKANYIRG